MSNLAALRAMGEDDVNRQIGSGTNKQDYEDGVDDSERELFIAVDLPIPYQTRRPFWQLK